MSWEPGVSADRRARPRKRRRAEDREALRRLTVGAAVAAAGLNIAMLFQIGFGQMGPGEVQDAIVSAVGGLFPGELQPRPQLPSPSPGGRPVMTSGGS